MTHSNTVSSSWDKPFEPPESIPDRADVVVIGGGIVGVSTAWFLAKQGVRVVLCEKGHIAGEQSGRNWGWVRVQGRDTREIPMMQEALGGQIRSCSVLFRQIVWPRYHRVRSMISVRSW